MIEKGSAMWSMFGECYKLLAKYYGETSVDEFSKMIEECRNIREKYRLQGIVTETQTLLFAILDICDHKAVQTEKNHKQELQKG